MLTTDPVPLWDRATPFCDIEDTPMEWIVPGLIVKGETTMMTGDFGSFKSYMTYFIADAITEGGMFVRRTAQNILCWCWTERIASARFTSTLFGRQPEGQKNAKLLGRFTTPVLP